MADDRSRDDPQAARRLSGALLAWFFVVGLYFLWETFSYRGLYAWLTEWEFARFGGAAPVLNFALLVTLFGVPALILLRRRTRDLKEMDSVERQEEILLARAARTRSILLGLAGAFTVAALAVLVYALTRPQFGAPPQQLTAETADGAIAEGPAQIVGSIDQTRIATFNQSLIVSERGTYFAPIAELPGTPVRFFTEVVRATDGSGQLRRPQTGILIRRGLPGPIEALYHAASGVPIAQPYYVLYGSAATVRWPYLIFAVQFAAAAIVLYLVSLLQHRHVRRRRTERRTDDRTAPGADFTAP